MNTKSQFYFHGLSITISLLVSCGLASELYLAHQGKSLCHASACAIVTKFVRFGEPTLLSLGAGGFLILAGLILFARRYQVIPFVRSLPVLFLIGSGSFDGALLGFQFITLRQHCQLCITVALSLGLIALLYSASLKKWSIFLSLFTAWTAGFLANALLIMPDTTEAQGGMIFYERPAAKEFTSPPEATLIFSLECQHCSEVLEALAKRNLNTITWRFAIIDESPKSYNKLSYFYTHLSASTNPFQLLLDSKKGEAKLDAKILVKFPEWTRETRIFLATNGLHAVPVLAYKEVNGKITLIPGSSAIISFLSSIKP